MEAHADEIVAHQTYREAHLELQTDITRAMKDKFSKIYATSIASNVCQWCEVRALWEENFRLK